MVAGEEAGLTVGLTNIVMDWDLLRTWNSPGDRGNREEDSILPAPVTGPDLDPQSPGDHGRGDGLGTPPLTS